MSNEKKVSQSYTEKARSYTEEKLNIITGEIIGSCIEVHKALGPGMLESSYKECLKYELE